LLILVVVDVCAKVTSTLTTHPGIIINSSLTYRCKNSTLIIHKGDNTANMYLLNMCVIDDISL